MRSVFAPWVTPSPRWSVPVRTTDPVTLITGVGNDPMSPLMVVVPVLVMPVPPRTANGSAVPIGTARAAAWAVPAVARRAAEMATTEAAAAAL